MVQDDVQAFAIASPRTGSKPEPQLSVATAIGDEQRQDPQPLPRAAMVEIHSGQKIEFCVCGVYKSALVVACSPTNCADMCFGGCSVPSQSPHDVHVSLSPFSVRFMTFRHQPQRWRCSLLLRVWQSRADYQGAEPCCRTAFVPCREEHGRAPCTRRPAHEQHGR